MVINAEGLFSYQKKDENYSFQIVSSDPLELWTRCERYSDCLIVKLLHLQGKTEFAIPLQDYCVRTSENWLYAFYRFLMEHRVNMKY